MKLGFLALGAGVLMLAACGDNRTDDVVKVPVEVGVPLDMSRTQAAAVESDTALALGMTRAQLEDADLVAANGTKLGEIDALVVDAGGKLTQMVIELEGPGDVKVQLPADQVTAAPVAANGERDVTTPLTAAELAALPKWTLNP